MYKRMNEQLQTEGAMALVTGASSGIGLAYARELARRGYDLLLVSNEQERIGTVAEELAAAFGVKTIPLCMDLARSEAARELYDYCEREKLQIGILVNNAGIFFFDDLTEVAPERIETMLLLHIRTVTLLCRYFGAAMKRRRAGYILNLGLCGQQKLYPEVFADAALRTASIRGRRDDRMSRCDSDGIVQPQRLLPTACPAARSDDETRTACP